MSSGEAAGPPKKCRKRVADAQGKVYMERSFLAEKRSKHEDHLPIMPLRRGERGYFQGLSKDRNHALVLFHYSRDTLYHVAAIEGRQIPGVPAVPRGQHPADEKKRMESI
jgi:hypothetical protein